MRILVLGINYPPEQIGIGPYTGELCASLRSRAADVTVVTTHPYYPQWRVFPGAGRGWSRRIEGGVEVLRCPVYVPGRPSGAKRLLHHASFAVSVLIPLLWRAVRERPDLVFVVAPSLAAAPSGLMAAKLAGAPTWLHLQDFEVEAAFATGLLDPHSRLASAARAFERWMLARFDVVSSISPEMVARLAAMGVAKERRFELRNWARLDAVRPSTGPSPFRAEWGIRSRHVALYSGNIANKQGIEQVVDAARLLRDRADLSFVICGDGPNRADLEATAADLPNVVFRGLQPAERLNDLLALATVHLLPQRADAADLVLPSKLTNMLASGRPVVAAANPGTGLHREVEGAGVAVAPEDPAAMAAAITALLDDPAWMAALSSAARIRAEQVWSREKVMDGFMSRLKRVLAGRDGHKPSARLGTPPRRPIDVEEHP
jgi:colanic acid biosynthesis glycosyl transferase WcaI